jgi:hypothetical protein
MPSTAQQLATWVVAYNAPFPKGTFCQEVGIQAIGGVLANSQNHHIGPSFCTNSGSALLRLHKYTGEIAPLRLLEDTITGIPQYVCSGREPYKLMKPGMVTEQFNMSDEMGNRGDVWEVSASWPETCVLLSAGEVPSVYVDLKTGTCATFDHIDVQLDTISRTLHLINPTTFPASIRIQKSSGDEIDVYLASFAQQTIHLEGI